MNLSIDNRLLRHGLTVLGVASAALAGAADWKLSGSNEWNTAKQTMSDGVPELLFTGSGNGESEARLRTGRFRPGGWYALDFEFSTELKFREWPVGAPFVELPFRREELWEPTAVRRHVTWRFQAPETLADGADFLRCGQKDHTGSVRMRNFVLRPVTPLAATVGDDTPLRRHEAIFGNTFYANEDVATVGRRTEFTAENPLVLRYALPGRKFTGAKLHYNGSNTRIEFSRDGVNYTVIGEHRENGAPFRLLGENDSSAALHLRLTPLDPSMPGRLNHTRLSAAVDGRPLHTAGRTFFVESADRTKPHLSLRKIGFDPETMRCIFTLDAVNPGQTPQAFRIALRDNGTERAAADAVTVAPQECETVTIVSTLPETGERVLTFTDPQLGTLLRADTNLPVIDDLAHGVKLKPAPAGAELWSASSSYHVNRRRPAPEAEAEALALKLARNESASRQLVLRGTGPEQLAELLPRDLVSESGDVLPANLFDVRLVEYLFITNPTDETGTTGFWTDPASPVSGPAAVRPGENTPLLVTVKTAPDTPAGLYRGNFELKLGADAVKLPVTVRVWDFALPDTLSTTATSELAPRYIAELQRLGTDAEKREAYNRYLKLFADSHVSPYDPTPFDHPAVTWPEDGSDEVKIDFSAYKRELERVLSTYHFKRFVISIPLPPGIKRLSDPMTPEQEAQFASAARQYERFYEENGLLDTGFVYTWDEPHVNVFPDADRCLDRYRKYAPKLKLMMTPFWVQERWRPRLDIWAFLSNHYVGFAADACRRKGEELWWYVCTGPRAPYTTGFIDHGGAEFRTWLWQTRRYDMAGTLYWSSTVWCDAMKAPGYPARNVYETPVFFNESGNEFGNGDGLLVYPPRAAYEPGTGPLLSDPVTSLRLTAWRDGLEDVEYFKILEKALAEKRSKLTPAERKQFEALLEVPADVAVSLYEYNKLPDALERHRAKLARAIERLNGK